MRAAALLVAVAFAACSLSADAAKSTGAAAQAAAPRPLRRPSALDRLRRTAGGGGGPGSDPKGPRSKLQATAAQEFVIGLLSGAAAGMAVDLTLYPLDTIKTRLQASSNARFSLKTLQGIYDGVGPAIAASAPACAAFFGAYDSLKRYLTRRVGDQYGPLVNMAAAAGGDLTQSVVRVPFEVVKQRLQAGVDKTWQEAVSNILAARGPRGFFAGWSALALRDLPFDIIEFPLYEALKDAWARKKGAKLETWESSLCGSLAGGIAAGLTTPLDVVKTRLMTQRTGGSVLKYTGLMDCLVKVSREEGMGALYKGLVPRVVNIALGGAIFFGAYEAVKKVVEPAIIEGNLRERVVAACVGVFKKGNSSNKAPKAGNNQK